MEYNFKRRTDEGIHMTPRQRSWLEIGLLIIAFMSMLGGAYLFGSSRDSRVAVLESKVESLEQNLHRMEAKIDLLLQRK